MELRRWIHVLCILPALQDFLDFRAYSLQCPDTHYLTTQGGNERCCKKCLAGERVKQHCLVEQVDSTTCVACPNGRYQSEANSKTFCTPCGRQYKANRKLLKNCTRFHNQEYGECNAGFYHSLILDVCKKCNKCPLGHGVVRYCAKTSNTQCTKEKCPLGKYSDQESWTQKCTLCTPCKINEEMVKECTHSSNYECRPKITTTPTNEVLITSTPSTVSTSHKSIGGPHPTDDKREQGRSWVMPFFIAAMVLLLILFLAFVIGVTIWCHIQSRNRQENVIMQADPQVVQRLTKCVDDVESVCLPNESCYQYSAIPVPEERKPETVRENGMMIRDVSHDIIEELANFLNPTNPPSNWRKVASMMDFPWNIISNMALSPTTATQQLLERWGTKRDSTVYKLYEILKDIGRDDAAGVLERLLVQPVPSCPKSV